MATMGGEHDFEEGGECVFCGITRDIIVEFDAPVARSRPATAVGGSFCKATMGGAHDYVENVCVNCGDEATVDAGAGAGESAGGVGESAVATVQRPSSRHMAAQMGQACAATLGGPCEFKGKECVHCGLEILKTVPSLNLPVIDGDEE
jgi:hypothetical protein